MKENFLYEQVDDCVAITAVTFDYHSINGIYKLTQKKKIPSIRLAKRFFKVLIEEFIGSSTVIAQGKRGHITKCKNYTERQASA